MSLPKEYKEKLGLLLATGHAKFGPVAPRRPYHDDEGGEGTPGLTVETHPLFANIPIGAPSDLTNIVDKNNGILDEALNRDQEELDPSLRNQPALQAELSQRFRYTPKITRS